VRLPDFASALVCAQVVRLICIENEKQVDGIARVVAGDIVQNGVNGRNDVIAERIRSM
jgi:hypothetical protein